MLHIGMSLTDNARVIMFICNMFIIQATGVMKLVELVSVWKSWEQWDRLKINWKEMWEMIVVLLKNAVKQADIVLKKKSFLILDLGQSYKTF